MSAPWRPAPGMHAVRFYDQETALQDSVSAFFAGAIRAREPAVMIARPRTFEAVAHRLTAADGFSRAELADGLIFLDADAALGGFMDGGRLDPVRTEQGFATLMGRLRRQNAAGTVWLFGEMVDLLCKQGNFAAALQIEQLWNARFAAPRVSVLCAYAIHGFDSDAYGSQLRTVCRQHTHVLPFDDSPEPDQAGRAARLALRRWESASVDRSSEDELAASRAAGTIEMVYVIDDDESIRRSLSRLLSLHDLRVRTFASAEAFLDQVDDSPTACLIVDVQLPGMSGLDLQARMAAANWSMPVIALSGSHDVQVEKQALRQGAVTFLRKPLDPQRLVDVVLAARSPAHW